MRLHGRVWCVQTLSVFEPAASAALPLPPPPLPSRNTRDRFRIRAHEMHYFTLDVRLAWSTASSAFYSSTTDGRVAVRLYCAACVGARQNSPPSEGKDHTYSQDFYW